MFRTIARRLLSAAACAWLAAPIAQADGVAITPIRGTQLGELRIEPQRHELRLDSPSQVPGLPVPAIEFIGRRVPPTTRPFVLIGGGSGGWDPAEPLGLLVVDHRVRAPLANLKMPSGILCIQRSGEAGILSLDQYRQDERVCQSALQAIAFDGRTLHSAGGQVIACQRADGLSFYAFSSMSGGMPDLDLFRKRPCSAALNLAGLGQAGMIWFGSDSRGGYGSDQVAVAAVIVVHERGQPVVPAPPGKTFIR